MIGIRNVLKDKKKSLNVKLMVLKGGVEYV
jgi:hypothetical protein